MMDDFEAAEVETGATTIFVRWSGAGSSILLLHGFPQSGLGFRVSPSLGMTVAAALPIAWRLTIRPFPSIHCSPAVSRCAS